MEDFEHLEEGERLKAENDFLKMKLMLERDMNFETDKNNNLPAALENEFLKNIIEFEKQFENQKRIKLFDKIGRPSIFKPVNEIPDDNINEALHELLSYLGEHNICLDVCSPNISARELYRFTIEELFEYEMDDMDLPGWTSNFIYDEFHPDPIYDNTRLATEDCMGIIFSKKPLEWMTNFFGDDLRFNQHYPLTSEQFKQIVNRFKLAYDNIELNDIQVSACVADEKESQVTGTYTATALLAGEAMTFSGQWMVLFEPCAYGQYWDIKSVTIEGVNF